MDESLNTKLSVIERQIKEVLPASSDTDLYIMIRNLGGKEKEYVRDLLVERQGILDGLLICSPAEIARMKEVNDRLYSLTKSLYNKTYSLYKALLKTGYDPDFDDDIMIEGTLKFLVDSWEDSESVLKIEEDKEYGSDFLYMMDLICHLEKDSYLNSCARTFLSYNPKHTSDVSIEELHMNNTLDNGVSWDHAGLFKDLCVCHAIYSLRSDNLYSYPDIFRMNDFWCEVKVTHQLLTDLEGKRYSCIEDRLQRKS